MERYTYSKEQLQQYFDRIALPQDQRVFSIETLNGDDQLDYLTTLVKHQIVRIPFENLTQHYSWHRVIDVHPLHLHRKIVGSEARGGYCLENNTLFHTVLRSLGFRCYQAAGRVWVPAEKKWTGWSHVVNIVVIEHQRYLCDVGFGPREPTQPLPMLHDLPRPQIRPAESRLVHEKLPQGLIDQKLWIYQYREHNDAPFVPAYCFSETELLPGDLEGLNYAPSIGRNSHFTQKVIFVRLSVGKERPIDGSLPESDIITANEINGAMILNQDNFKWRRQGEEVFELNLATEADRLKLLREWLGIDLDEEDQRAIAGTVAALKPTT